MPKPIRVTFYNADHDTNDKRRCIVVIGNNQYTCSVGGGILAEIRRETEGTIHVEGVNDMPYRFVPETSYSVAVPRAGGLFRAKQNMEVSFTNRHFPRRRSNRPNNFNKPK